MQEDFLQVPALIQTGGTLEEEEITGAEAISEEEKNPGVRAIQVVAAISEEGRNRVAKDIQMEVAITGIEKNLMARETPVEMKITIKEIARVAKGIQVKAVQEKGGSFSLIKRNRSGGESRSRNLH